MDQAPSLTFGSMPAVHGFERDDSAPRDSFYPAAGGVYIPRFHNLDGQANPGFLRGIHFQGVMGRFPVPDSNPGVVAMMGYGEMLPHRDNIVRLDGKRIDAWGIPVPYIRCVFSENERTLMREQVRAAREMSETCGYQLNFNGSALGLDSTKVFTDADPISRLAFRMGFRRSVAMGAAIHECGGARMGSDPATSVLNEFNQCWDAPNIVVTDGSCYATNGLVGPTLTIMALTARACEHLAREHATGSL
jgi:choline dehydrogenase-like flavoprotein